MSLKKDELLAAQDEIIKLKEIIGIYNYFCVYFLFLKYKALTLLFLDRLNQRSTSQEEAVSVLRSTISVLDKEKDSLQETVDEKTERIACLDDNLANRVCPVKVLFCIPPGGF